MTQCVPHIPSWHWGVSPAGITVTPRPGYADALTLAYGSPAEVFADLDGIAFAPPRPLRWRSPRPHLQQELFAALANPCGKAVWVEEAIAEPWYDVTPDDFSDEPDAAARLAAARRARDLSANLHVLTHIGEAIGLRLDPTRGWRALSANAILHFQFGPGLAVATNGTDVVLWSQPAAGCDWMLAHRNNVIGPVTGTPHAVADWDYLGNRAARVFASAQRDPGRKSATRLARERAEALL